MGDPACESLKLIAFRIDTDYPAFADFLPRALGDCAMPSDGDTLHHYEILRSIGKGGVVMPSAAYERMLSLAHGSPSPYPGLPIKDGFCRHVYVYAICKNEAHNVERFISWGVEADGVFFLDTGSTDGTQDLLRQNGAIVEEYSVNPWRFDEAKNRAMALVPDDADICICFNLDETMFPITGWRRQLELAWGPWVSQARYKYVAHVSPDAAPNPTYWFTAIHSRHGYVWRYPTHEVLYGIPGQHGETITTSLECRHARPHWKQKSDDLSLLRLALQEEPDDERCLHYYGRELCHQRRWQEAMIPLQRHLQVSGWSKEKAASANMLAACSRHSSSSWEVEKWLLRAVAEAPEMREHWVYLGRYYMNERRNYAAGYYCGKRALEISYCDISHYSSNERDWRLGPLDLLSVCAWHMGLKAEAGEAVKEALALAPDDRRVQSNYELIMAK
jgi:hypothetical protein